jgi:hypothetical protein
MPRNTRLIKIHKSLWIKKHHCYNLKRRTLYQQDTEHKVSPKFYTHVIVVPTDGEKRYNRQGVEIK